MTVPQRVALGILAGGAARRMGGADKPLLLLGDGRPVLAHLLDRLAPWPGPVLLNANGDPARFNGFGLPVVADPLFEADGGPAGPLAGLLAVLEWTAAAHPDVSWLVSVPGDAPFAPPDLLARLWQARVAEGADMAVATSGGRDHPVVGLWPVALAPALRVAMEHDSLRAARRWAARHRAAVVAWPTDPVDPFMNLNAPDDLARAHALTAPA
ncbi:molybdenum cofactor guanylyltransferase MobA [Rhodospira trueperi]|uniref:Molybdenum cofactor guanylyltransferase n=1 Tax=Rhodospira trueperi TaxID=69960 RepID=A0A1G7BVT7_9PROT|nr:molybdenum cofactor guanylyltransferase MobA [Rhodospira trueperi]SDE30680.1 molybdopterin-guanine dinucleotide biosynthesis protein A [Rhodospira trueperi]